MKPIIAVELAGYMRTFNDSFRSWTNLLDYDNFDFHFFVDTYTESGILPLNPPRTQGYDIDKTDIFDFFGPVKKWAKQSDVIYTSTFSFFSERVVNSGNFSLI